ncbi:MAG: Anucleate primary sterigmata protein B [Vezdaea aestivalis]|nr:MAG: Anucleate primary sterigmata protein B [Vezdaea aestivalis]
MDSSLLSNAQHQMRSSQSHSIPGSFDDDDNDLPSLPDLQNRSLHDTSSYSTNSALPPLPSGDSSLLRSNHDNVNDRGGLDTDPLDEREMRKKLMDIESSFLPEHSMFGTLHPTGADDSILGFSNPGDAGVIHNENFKNRCSKGNALATAETIKEEDSLEFEEQPTPPGRYKTPALIRSHSPDLDLNDSHLGSENISSLEAMSSPTAAALARTVHRAASMATLESYETANQSPFRPSDHSDEASQNGEAEKDGSADETTPKKKRTAPSVDSVMEPPTMNIPTEARDQAIKPMLDDAEDRDNSLSSSRRPKHLRSRNASQRSSISSYTGSTDNASDATLGADYALQSGGAVPTVGSQNRHSSELSRSISLGSIASGLSQFGDPSEKDQVPVSISSKVDPIKSSLERTMPQVLEEDDSVASKSRTTETEDFKTPRVNGRTFIAPTDTVIARHVQNVHVPDSVAAEYCQNNKSSSPDKKPTKTLPTPRKGFKNLTLKEQTSTIDKLTKENFNLKLKIWALETSLDKRSEEGIKEMISENVDLKQGYATAQKDIKSLKKQVRILEKRLKDHEEGQASRDGSDAQRSPTSFGVEEALQMEETIIHLRERTETYEYEIERLRNESVTKEGEKRQLAEMVSRLSDRRSGASDVGSREIVESWRDLFDAEQLRRAQADEENRKLREELRILRSENGQNSNFRDRGLRPTARSVSSTSERGFSGYDAADPAAESLLQQVKQDNQSLRAQLLSQTSMLTSRNKEMDRLYNEIEDLKLGIVPHEAARSVAGDSIFERSASRAHERSLSRTSGPQKSQVSDAERDEFDRKEGNLLDQILDLKLKNQALTHDLKQNPDFRSECEQMNRELDQCVDDLAHREAELRETQDRLSACEAELEDVAQSLQQMQFERNELLVNLETKEIEVEDLRNEAQNEIDELDAALAKAEAELQRVKTERDIKTEDFDSLQHHTRTLNDMSVRFEDQKVTDDQRIQALERDIEEARQELQHVRKDLSESNGKVERLTVEQESSQQRIAFLNEEQDGDKIIIGNLQAGISRADNILQDEKERSRDLERRLSAERHQREVIGGQEKQEVQRIMNDLNLQISAVKDEARRLKRNTSIREGEALDWKTRFLDLDKNLRTSLGDSSGSNIIKLVQGIQKNLSAKISEMEELRDSLLEKETLLQTRDGLLERSALDTKRLTDLLEKERTARRLESHQCEQIQRTSEQTHRFLKSQESKVKELEVARSADRRKLGSIDNKYKDQLSDRNALLLTLWNRLSLLCGNDWAHKHSLVNGRALPSLEVIATQLPGFSQNLHHAIKTVEMILQSFKSRIRSTERDLWKSYQSLEHNLDVKLKRLDRIESLVNSGRSVSQGDAEQLAKFKGENKLLKAELAVLHKQDATTWRNKSDSTAENSNRAVSTRPRQNSSSGASNSGTDPTALARAFNPSATYVHNAASPTDPSEQRWILRLRELERRLKAEREARLQDRTGAQKRLQEGRAENEELKLELQRERVRHATQPLSRLE